MFENILNSLLSAGGISSVFTILVIGFLGLMALIYTLNKTKISLNFSLGPVKIALGKKETQLTQKTLNQLIESQLDNIREMIAAEDNLLKRQLLHTEQKLTQIKYFLVTNFNELLSKKLGKTEDARIHKDYRNYQILVTMLNKELLDKVFKSAFIENHLTEFEGANWNNYITDKSNYIMNFINEFMDIMYGEGKVLSRQETANIEKDAYDDILKVVREIFDNVKEMSLNSALELDKMKESSKLKIIDACKKNGIIFEQTIPGKTDDP